MAAHVASTDDLELLMALIEAPDRWWDAEAASRAVRLPVGAARAILDRFACGNLLDIRVTGDVRYRFRPGTPELIQGAAAFAEACRAHPTEMMDAVGQCAGRTFTDVADKGA
jgi:hypothetical protein